MRDSLKGHVESLGYDISPEGIRANMRVRDKDEYPCVYFLWKDGEIVYVGQTLYHPAHRILGHWNKDFDHYSYIPVEKEDRINVEYYLIETLSPKLNGGVPEPVLRGCKKDKFTLLKENRFREYAQ